MSRLCLDSPRASHLTRFTSLSSNEGSQGSLYLISTTSALTSTALSLSLTPFQTHRALQHCLDMPSITLPRGFCICCSFCLERSYLGLARGFLALFLGSCLYERKISMITLWKSASFHSAIVLYPPYTYSRFFFFSCVYHHWKHYMFICLCGRCYLLTATPTRMQASQGQRPWFFFHLSTLVLRAIFGT